MKTEFRTIEIKKLVLSYSGIFAFLLGFHVLFDLTIYPVFLLVIPVPLYIMFRGKIRIEITRDYLSLQWLKKPFWSSMNCREIYFSDIIRWKYQKGFRSPDRFTIILESGEKIAISPSLFNMKNLETELFKKLGERIEEYYTDTPKELLLQKIGNSAYLETLSQKIYSSKILMLIAGIFGFAVLILAAINNSVAESDLTWMLFFSLFCIFFVVYLWHHYLKSEKEKTLN
ncbi:hypothetical protein [Salinimicrobium flavum]|uniref:PH domain-containing protein n=1 Tax=Salinimicrobium flavum TaxID=1737065 RepID=A0ABW5IZ94_9FLAO